MSRGLGDVYKRQSKGFVPTKKWKKERFGTSWLVGDTLNVGIGQGFSLATPLQLAVMTARLASGKEVIPNLIKNPSKYPNDLKTLSIGKNTLAAIRKGMFNVLNKKEGTAFNFRTTDENFLIAGKTGTSHKSSSKGGYDQSKYMASFAGIAPLKTKRLTIFVNIDEPGLNNYSGGSVAAPLFAAISKDVLNYLNE